MEKNRMVPELRFSENNDNWKIFKFKSLYSFQSTNSLSRDELNYENGTIKNIHYGDIHTQFQSQFFAENEKVPYISNVGILKKISKENYLNPGDIVFADASEDYNDIGKAIEIIDINDEKIVAGLHTIHAKKKTDKTQNGFVGYSLMNHRNRLQIMRIAQGTKVLGLSSKLLGEVELILPVNSEQQKIAKFLSSVDQRIRLLEERKEKLQSYKKGVMQQIFTQQIRFKQENGCDFPEWEIIKGKDLFKNYSNKNHNSDLPILAASQEKGMVLRDENGINIKTSEASVKSYKVVEKGDFVISLRSFQGGIEYSNIEGICSPAYIILKPKKTIDDLFYKYYFKKESFIERLSKTVIGIRDGKQITYENFGGLKLFYPSINEQKKISNFLLKIDQKIDQTQTQIDQTKEFKKGLLQKMFV